MGISDRRPSACACRRASVDAAALRSKPNVPSRGVISTSARLRLDGTDAGRTVVMSTALTSFAAAKSTVTTKMTRHECW